MDTAISFLNLHAKLGKPKIIRPSNYTQMHKIIPAVDGKVIDGIIILCYAK
mgnify:CR=1 FL=1